MLPVATLDRKTAQEGRASSIRLGLFRQPSPTTPNISAVRYIVDKILPFPHRPIPFLSACGASKPYGGSGAPLAESRKGNRIEFHPRFFASLDGHSVDQGRVPQARLAEGAGMKVKVRGLSWPFGPSHPWGSEENFVGLRVHASLSIFLNLPHFRRSTLDKIRLHGRASRRDTPEIARDIRPFSWSEHFFSLDSSVASFRDNPSRAWKGCEMQALILCGGMGNAPKERWWTTGPQIHGALIEGTALFLFLPNPGGEPSIAKAYPKFVFRHGIPVRAH